MQMLFSTEAERIARETGLIQRQRKLTGASLAQSLVFGWLANPEERLTGLAQNTARVGTPVKPQSLEQRFNEKSVAFMQKMVECAMQHAVQGEGVESKLFRSFGAVRVADSSHLEVPLAFAEQYPGCGNQQGKQAGLKLQANLELVRGGLRCELQTGRESDHRSEVAFESAAGELSVRDLGYFGVNHFEQIQQQGAYFLSRVPADHVFYDAQGQKLSFDQYLHDGLDREVYLGKRHHFKVRLVVLKVPQAVREQRIHRLDADAKRKGRKVCALAIRLAGWDIRISNAPSALLSLEAVFVLSRLRWQIELCFKLFKSVNLLEQSRSRQPARILTELFAKLLACLLQHWCIVAIAWSLPEKSLVRLAALVQAEAFSLVRALASLETLRACLQDMRRIATTGSSVQRRRSLPAAFQLLDLSYA
jgi:hypothetical protein